MSSGLLRDSLNKYTHTHTNLHCCNLLLLFVITCLLMQRTWPQINKSRYKHIVFALWPFSNYRLIDVFCYALRKPTCVWCNTSSIMMILQGDWTRADMMPDTSIFCPPSLIEIHSDIERDGERVISWEKIAACPCFRGFYLPRQGNHILWAVRLV
jgi:hypothetical protein